MRRDAQAIDATQIFPLTSFSADGSRVSIQRTGTSDYKLIQDLGSDRYWTINLSGTLSIGGEFMRIGDLYVSRMVAAHNRGNGLVFSGTWVEDVNILYFGGHRDYTLTTGSYVQVVTAPGVTEVALYGLNISIGGVHLVTIDGDNTLANLLPTAQDLVTAGTLAASALVGGGGTLNPTDRILDTYAAGPVDHKTYFSQTLTPAVHTVRVTNTGYKHVLATNDLLYCVCFFSYGPGAYDLAIPLPYFEVLYPVFNSGGNPVWEISYSTKPTGAVGYEWIGHTGSLKFTVLPTFVMDGDIVTLAIWQNIDGFELSISMQFGVRHTELGAVNIGLLDLTYKLSHRFGLTIQHTLEWLTGALVTGYPGMMSLTHSTFDRFATLASTIGTDLTASDGTYHFDSTGQFSWAWDFNGYLGVLMYIPSLQITVENWAHTAAPYRFIWLDIAVPGWKKSYAFRYGTDFTFASGNVINSEVNYRMRWFTGGANTALSR